MVLIRFHKTIVLCSACWDIFVLFIVFYIECPELIIAGFCFGIIKF